MRTPRLNRFPWIWGLAIVVAAAFGCAEDSPSGLEGLPASTFEVDESIQPVIASLPGFSEGASRPIAALVDEDGAQVEFVENEVLVVTDDQAKLNAFLQRWSGQIIHEPDFTGTELAGLPRHALVRVQSENAEVGRLSDLVREIHPDRRNDLRVSSRPGLELLAVAASEQVDGLDVAVNWVGRPSGPFERTTTEAPAGDDFGGVTYSANAYDWPTHNIGSEQDIGTAEAWRLLTVSGRLENRVKIAILDQGYLPADSSGLPEGTTHHANAPFLDPFRPAVQSAGHGAKVAHAAMSLPNDSFGSAGSAGPIGVGVLIYTGYDFVTSMTALARARFNDAQIANMSYSGDVPAILGWTARPFQAVTRRLSDNGMLIFAAAGNDGADVDKEKCGRFGKICWEKTWHAPCENDGVICVGGIEWNSDNKDPGSNYGDGHVDIWGPYSMWLGPDPSEPENDATIKFGTSYSSPYVAGVAALVWAANPSLDAGQVWDFLEKEAHTSRNVLVNRIVNARGAVAGALGGETPPFVRITAPAEGATFSRGSQAVPLNAQVDDLEGDIESIVWSSNRDGAVAEGAFTSTNDLSVGTHELTVTVTDSTELSIAQTVTISVKNDPPEVEIISPDNGATFFESQTISLQATSFDPNEQGSLPDDGILWYLNTGARPFATGHATTLAATTLPLGNHTITVVADDGVASDEDDIVISVQSDPVGNVGPTAFITAPTAGSLHLADSFDAITERYYANVTLCAHGEDPEDGRIEGNSVTWYKREQGTSAWFVAGNDPGTNLCLNHRLFWRSPNTTTYELRAIVKDADGDTDAAIITVRVYGLI
jgi:subtilisin family serine protease